MNGGLRVTLAIVAGVAVCYLLVAPCLLVAMHVGARRRARTRAGQR